MNYKVKHTELYVPEPIIKTFDSLEDLLNRYSFASPTFCEISDIPTKSGDIVSLQYDHYIILEITAI